MQMEEGVQCSEVVVRDDGELSVSKATQTGEQSDLVQINASLSELNQRIEAFVQFKQHQVNLSNQTEFCVPSPCSDSTCARVDAAYVRRAPNTRNIPAYRVYNVSGPTPLPPSPLAQLKHDLFGSNSSWSRTKPVRGGTSSALLGLPERVANLEGYTNLYEGGPTPRDLLQRVHNLEMKVLQLEGHSPEYHHAARRATKSLPKSKQTHLHALLPSGHPAHMTNL